MLLETSDEIADKAIVMEFGPVLELRKSLIDTLFEHNLTEDSIDSIVAHTLSRVLVTNFCIGAQEASRHPCLSLSNSSIQNVKYLVEPLCMWFISASGLVDKIYRLAPNGDGFVSIRACGARITFIISVNQRRLY